MLSFLSTLRKRLIRSTMVFLQKLQSYGICNRNVNWFKDYLSHRSQRCYVNGALSNTEYLTCGIPQGTILGPLLFLIYINDLPNCLKFSDTQMYADDSSITMASESSYEIETKMNIDLDNIYEWLKANRLSLNTAKTEFMLIASRQRSGLVSTPRLEIGAEIIPKSEVVKSLGVQVDQTLSWSKHVERISTKISSSIYRSTIACQTFCPHELAAYHV